MLTIDRYWMTRYTLENLLAKALRFQDDKYHPAYEIELLILDNGSKDERVIEYCKEVADVFIPMSENIGVARGFNELFKRSTGDYICLVGNDIILNEGWLQDLVQHNDNIDKSGITAIHCVLAKGDYTPLPSNQGESLTRVWAPKTNLVYGVSLFKRTMLQTVGGFDENFGLYGCEDTQLAFRVSHSGFHNYYIPNQYSTHIGSDFEQSSEYRTMKNNNLRIAENYLKESIERMFKSKNYKVEIIN